GETDRARLPGTMLELEPETERRGVPLHAPEDGQIDLRDTEGIAAVAFGIEEAGEEAAAVAAGVALRGGQCVGDREPGECADLDPLHQASRGRAGAKRSNVSFHPEAGENLDEA